MKPLAGIMLSCCVAASLSGCEKAKQDMYDQPKYKPLARAVFERSFRGHLEWTQGHR